MKVVLFELIKELIIGKNINNEPNNPLLKELFDDFKTIHDDEDRKFKHFIDNIISDYEIIGIEEEKRKEIWLKQWLMQYTYVIPNYIKDELSFEELKGIHCGIDKIQEIFLKKRKYK